MKHSKSALRTSASQHSLNHLSGLASHHLTAEFTPLSCSVGFEIPAWCSSQRSVTSSPLPALPGPGICSAKAGPLSAGQSLCQPPFLVVPPVAESPVSLPGVSSPGLGLDRWLASTRGPPIREKAAGLVSLTWLLGGPVLCGCLRWNRHSSRATWTSYAATQVALVEGYPFHCMRYWTFLL